MSATRRLLAAAIAFVATMLAAVPPAHAAEAAAEPVAQVLVMLVPPPAHARLDGAYGGGYGPQHRQSQGRVAERLATAHGLHVTTQWAMPALGMDCIVMDLPPAQTVAQVVQALETHPEVAWAQPMNRFEAQGHADPLFALQPATRAWHLDEMHEIATGRDVQVALLDSGVDGTHPDLARQIAQRVNFVAGQDDRAESHGTAVAGLIAARADNGVGIVGVAPDARLLALRACWEVAARTLCDTLSLAKALHFAIDQHAEVINMSLSGPDDRLLGRLIDVALARREQVVAAVDATAPDGGFPASHPGVIAVADGLLAAPDGPRRAWSAPARDLPAPLPGGGWGLVAGSSFASAQVAGLLAVLDEAARRPGAQPVRLIGTAAATRVGGGDVDTCASLALAAARPACGANGARSALARP